ncbi:MAG: FeoB-associated Cys-rich membrane protein [Lachnospiraceae bacterium]|nr:FeoB-associated Cys-rich membrane protein [Lachnospiraceae bacterium]
MFIWIAENIGTIIVSAILIAIVTAVIFKMIKDKKNGITSCGGNCTHCSMCASCKNTGSKNS